MGKTPGKKAEPPPSGETASGTPYAVTAADHPALLQIAMHEETILGERSGMFLVTASILLLGLVDVRDKMALGTVEVCVGLALGLLLAFAWAYTVLRQRTDMKACLSMLEGAGGSEMFRAFRDKTRLPGRHFIVAFTMYGLPVMFLALWAFLLLKPLTPPTPAGSGSVASVNRTR